MDPRVILKASLQGSTVTPIEAVVLLQNYPTHMLEINETANKINKRLNRNVVTFAHSKHISYTNICRYRCKYCSFARRKHDGDSFVLTVDEVIQRIKDAPNLDQVCIYGGLNTDLKFSYYFNMVQQIRKQFPSLHIQAFSPQEILYMAKRSKQSSAEVLQKLKDAGIDSLGGYDAEILNDKLRKKICPDKIKTAEWVDIIKSAHRLGIKTTATIFFGHLEDEIHIAEHLEIIRNIQKETEGFTEFVPIPFSTHTTKFADLVKLSSKWRDRAGYLVEDEATFRLLAVSRIFFGNTIRTIQGGWFRLGLDNALKSLEIGANDLGETVFDETAVKNMRVKSGMSISPAKIRNLIKQAGKIPKERPV